MKSAPVAHRESAVRFGGPPASGACRWNSRTRRNVISRPGAAQEPAQLQQSEPGPLSLKLALASARSRKSRFRPATEHHHPAQPGQRAGRGRTDHPAAGQRPASWCNCPACRTPPAPRKSWRHRHPGIPPGGRGERLNQAATSGRAPITRGCTRTARAGRCCCKSGDAHR